MRECMQSLVSSITQCCAAKCRKGEGKAEKSFAQFFPESRKLQILHALFI
jgi:hypothetical protein